MLFADDIVLINETKSGINAKLDVWREVLESKGFKISWTKTEYMKCNFSRNKNTNEETVKIASQEIRSEKFKYLGSIIQQEGKIGKDVNHRVQTRWVKWRSALGVLHDRRIPLKLKEKFYKTAIRPTILYGTECWTILKQHVNKLSVTKCTC